MIIDALSALAELLIESLKGIINFCEEFIPLLLKNAFCISPFILSVVVAYKLGGLLIAFSVAVINVLLFVVGISWAINKGMQDRELTEKLIYYVLIIDIILILLLIGHKFDIGKVINWNDLPKSQADKNIRQQMSVENESEFFKIKESEFLDLLKDAITNDNYSDIMRAISELKRMNCKSLKPFAINALDKYHSDASDTLMQTNDEGNKYKVCVACIEALASIKAEGVCQVLYRVQARQPCLYNTVEKAANEICK